MEGQLCSDYAICSFNQPSAYPHQVPSYLVRVHQRNHRLRSVPDCLIIWYSIVKYAAAHDPGGGRRWRVLATGHVRGPVCLSAVIMRDGNARWYAHREVYN